MMLVALLTTSALVVPVQADALQDGTSLKFAPADVSFYASLLRTREQYEKVANSKAIAKLMQMPPVQMGLFVAKAQWENPENPQVAMFKQMLAQPENQQLVAMLTDAVSNEIFWYGQTGFAEMIMLFNEINTAQNMAQLEAMQEGDPERAQEIMLEKVVGILDAHGDLKIPASVTGFKLTNPDAAEAQLQRLEALANAVLAQQPALQERFAREQLGGGSFLTLRLDGTLIPWDQMPADQMNIDPAKLEKLKEKIKATKLTISLGVREGYLLLSLGEDNQHLGKLGQGELLYDRQELAALKKAADKPMTGVSYVSKEFMEKVGTVDGQINQMTDMAKQFMPMAPIDESIQEELLADIVKFGDYVKANAPKQGAAMSYAFMTPRGIESFSYSWAENITLDATQQLSILNHVGGNPLAFYAARGKSSPDDYDELAKVCERIAYYIEKIVLPNAEPQEQEAYAKLKADFMPLLERLGAVTRDKLMPAFKDGQGAFVLDAKSRSASWHMALPESDPPLPMLEFGMVFSVSDASLAREAFGEYFSITQEALDKLHEASTGELKDMFEEEVPKITLTKPQTHEAGGGTIYFYALPEASGVDKQLAPNGGLSDSVMAVSLLPRFTERLMTNTPVQGEGPLANTNRPLAAAAHLNFAGLIEAIEPWINFGIGMSMGGFPTATQPGGQMQGWSQQVMDVLEVIKCFRAMSSVTYEEGGAMVTHAEWHFQDLE
jgi:hypothetical protein